MAKLLVLLVGIVVFQTSKAASSERSHPIITTNINEDSEKESEIQNAAAKLETIDDDTSRTQRQKRFYNYMAGYPPFELPSAFPFSNQPHFSKRDESQNTAVPGSEDALSIIYRRLHELVKDVKRQNVASPSHTPTQAFIPVFYIPQVDCSCLSNTQQPTAPVKPTSRPPIPPSTFRPLNSNATSTENSIIIEDRFSGMDDTDNDDGSRPINFNPVPTEEPIGVPVPPVEHGTVQFGVESGKQPNLPQDNVQREPPMIIEQSKIGSQTPIGPPPARFPDDAIQYPPTVIVEQSKDNSDVPSICDVAIVKCCNQLTITMKCFELDGCENPFIYGKPCDPSIQGMLVKKFQRYRETRLRDSKIRRVGIV